MFWNNFTEAKYFGIIKTIFIPLLLVKQKKISKLSFVDRVCIA